MKEENKYYVPDITEFHVGFEYQMKSTFGDGTVKTKEQYDRAEWIDQVYDLRSFPYVDRTMTGHNSQNLPSAIRVKYLDREDIESLGFQCDTSKGLWIYCIITDESGEEYYLDYHTETNECIIHDIDEDLFQGYIRNKNELQKILQWTGIRK